MVTGQDGPDSQITSALSGHRILVTGGTGFIGGRLVERLALESGAQLTVLLRNYARAPYVARFPVDMVEADLTDLTEVERAMEGCDIVLHCACQTDGSEDAQRAVNVDGTKNILEAAQRHGVKRVVHVSTINVYGPPKDGDLDETAPRQYSGDVYSDSKVDAEKLALGYADRVPVSVVQPTMVYGPGGPAWTTRILNDLKNGRVILVNDGQGLCNPVYVDDMVSGILRAAILDGAVGEAFLISGESPVTWREFYAAHEAILGVSRTVNMSAAEAEEHFKSAMGSKTHLHRESLNIIREEVAVRQRLRGTPEVQAMIRVARKLVPQSMRQSLKKRLKSDAPASVATEEPTELPINPLPPPLIKLSAAKTRVRIDKAQRLLDYQPRFSFEAGTWLTGQWARWANLLDDDA